MPKVEALTERISYALQVTATVASRKTTPSAALGRPAAPLSGGGNSLAMWRRKKDSGTPAATVREPILCGLRRLCAAALTTMVTGCSLGPAFQHPETNSPTAWRTADGHQEATWPAADWWHGFGSSQLDELIAQAEGANYDLAAAIDRVREADAQARIAGAALLPSVGATAGLTRQRTTPSGLSGRVRFPPDTTLVNPAISASYEFDFWGKNRASLEAAKASALASRYDEQVVELTVVAAVATTYFQILEVRDRLTVAQSNIAAAQKLLAALQAEQAAGTETVLDVVQQKTAVAALKAQVPPLTQQLQQSLDALAILIGRSPEALQQPSGTISDLSVPLVAPGLPSELLARRPDIAEAEAQLMAANADIKVARAAFFPSISLTAEGGIASLALAGITGPAGAVYAVTAGITQSIFSGGALQGKLEYSQARYDELLQNYRKAVISAFGDVEDALIATQQTALLVQRQEDTVAEARKAYAISTAQLQAGTVDLQTVLNTENALFPAEDSLAQARFAHLQATVSLFKALGGGWEQK
jgi:outer membrane protein, multidrug efflux system